MYNSFSKWLNARWPELIIPRNEPRQKFRVETAGNLSKELSVSADGTRQIGNHFSLNLVRGINSPPPQKKIHHFYPEKTLLLWVRTPNGSYGFFKRRRWFSRLPSWNFLGCLPQVWILKVKHLGGWPERRFLWGKSQRKPPPKLQVFPHRVLSQGLKGNNPTVF